MRAAILFLLCSAALAQEMESYDGTGEIENQIVAFARARGLKVGVSRGGTPIQLRGNAESLRLNLALLEHRLGFQVPGLLDRAEDAQEISQLASFIDRSRPPPAGEPLGRGRFLDRREDGGRTTAVDGDGTVYRIPAGGAPEIRSQGSRKLLSAHIVDGEEIWAVEGNGELVRTRDGGRTWQRASYGPASGDTPSGSHGLLPAPWYFASLVLVLFLVAQGLRRPDAKVVTDGTVADVLVSDRPLRKGDPDHLGFAAVALGLSRFIRNEKTEPPLTIAITGEWGTGKSSLMNLLREDLEERGFRPVAFNAWHHQQEDHLLAALLQNIKEHGVPPWTTLTGLEFRLRLLRKRMENRWPLSLAVLFLLSLSLVYVPKDLSALTSLFTSWDWSSASAILGLVTALVPVVKSLTAFAMKPAQLMASLQDSFKPKNLEAQAGFRARFAREFADVTEALQPRPLVILIDDLDRCKPGKVTEILEAVNFLVTCGNCFVILGLAKGRVEDCIGAAFTDLAVVPAGETATAEWRRDFARRYLEKLINIEVPVPRPRVEDTEPMERLVAAVGVAADDGRRARRARLARTAADLALAAALAAAVALGMGLGWRWRAAANHAPETVVATAEPKEKDAAQGKVTSDAAPTGQKRPAVRVGTLRSGEPSSTSRWPAYSIAVLLFGAGLWRLAIRPTVTVPDSQAFRDALKLWQPLIVSVRTTPRSVKRYLNRVRYLAMRQRRPPEEKKRETTRGRLLRLLGRPEEETALLKGSIPEGALVGLCAIGHSCPEWFGDRKPSQHLADFAKERIAALRGAPESTERKHAAQKWEQLVHTLDRIGLDAYLDEFLRTTGEVDVH